jgi:hypothetical protein
MPRANKRAQQSAKATYASLAARAAAAAAAAKTAAAAENVAALSVKPADPASTMVADKKRASRPGGNAARIYAAIALKYKTPKPSHAKRQCASAAADEPAAKDTASSEAAGKRVRTPSRRRGG